MPEDRRGLRSADSDAFKKLVAASHDMKPSLGALSPAEKYCSVMTALEEHPCHKLMAPCQALTTCPVLVHPPWTTTSPIHQRCSWVGHCPHFSDVTCTRFVGSYPLTINTPVLARREPDGFYYLATIIQESEGDRGVFLVEFDRPHPRGAKYPTVLQKTASDDLVQYLDAMRHRIVPGDKVLAPWEPQLLRYGPGTVVLGTETRDPLRAGEDEGITVSFWNGKRVKVPPGVAVRIPAAVWEQILTRLHLPISSRPKLGECPLNPTTYLLAEGVPTTPLLSCNPGCFYSHKWPHCFAPSYYSQLHPYYGHHRACWSPAHTGGSTCCCHPKCQPWWPLASPAAKEAEDPKEHELTKKPTLLCLEPPKQEAAPAAVSSPSSSSSSSSSSDTESDKGTCLTKSTMVDSAVNTDSSLWETPGIPAGERVRPDWKYWRRCHPEPNYRKPGSSVSSNCFTPKKSESGISWLDLSPLGPSNQGAMFEAIASSPGRRLTVRDVLSHDDAKPSQGSQAPPVQEKLGASQREQFEREQASIEQRRRQKLQQRERESRREQQAERQYTDIQELHRKKRLQHLQKEEEKRREKAQEESETLKAKQLAQLQRSLRKQTMAEEEKEKEQRRQAHLQHVRQKLDQRELRKCTADDIKEMRTQDARRKRVDTHYKLLAEKVYKTERQAQSKNAGRRTRQRGRSL
ncbi:uncharacterized protein C11orf16 homolog isoform X2 [Rhinatrema bivittatum]|uniref:uncharacterized protein C11orf16 homolog isoform X2 n=1 Tax=Rhinatrema bivittatum TaxID=194408 RepID=UPI00112CDD6E|nr:uncharacterized protein C11orf16 homolog isoform X2 [Rhinatrema bivittatum]